MSLDKKIILKLCVVPDQ